MTNKDALKLEYLKMIQEIIARMSTISTVIKGFVVTFAGALFTMIVDKNILNYCPCWFLFIPFLFLLYLDVYYLGLERAYRQLYELVRLEKKEVDFDLKINKKLLDKKEAKSDIVSCLCSRCIFVFYILIFLFLFMCMWLTIEMSKKSFFHSLFFT